MALTDTRPVADRPQPAPRTGRAPGAAAPRRRANLTPWRNAGLVAGALLAALGELHVVLRDLSWWFFPSLFVVVVLAAVAFARGFLRSRLLPSLIGLGVGLALLTFAYTAESAILGIIPMPASFERFQQLGTFGMDSIAFQTIRATPELGIVFLIAVLLIVCAIVSELLVALRHPSFVFLPLVIILGIPAIVEPGLSDAFWYIVAAAFYLAILRIGARPSSVRATWAAGAMVIVGSLIVPFIIPGIDDSDAPTVSGLRAGVNPLIDLGSNLRRGDTVLAATYQTSNATGAYLRLATLDDFNGRTWTPNMVAPTAENTVDDFPNPSGLTPPVAREELSADINVFDITGNWLPVPYPAESIEGLEGTWHWEESGLAVRSPNTTVSGQEYKVAFLDIEPTIDQLQSVLPAPEGTTSKFLELPRQMPPIIAATAHEIADEFDTAYDRANAIQDYFHTGDFHYSEDAPVRGGYDGEGADVIGVFLQEKTGYCVHYASAMAIMARVMGIPSRIAVGFQPGERSFDRGQTTFTVNSDDLHAWPELYFAGIGWLRFEPTPGRGTLPSWGVAAVDDPNTPQNEGAPLPSPSAVGVGPERPDQNFGPNQTGTGADESNPAGVISLTVLGILILLAFTPMGLRTGIRRWRYRAMKNGTDAAPAAWRELRDTAHDYGWSAPETETPRAFEERLAVVLSGDREELARFRGSVEASAYGRPDAGTLSVDELRAVRRAIARTTPWQTRLRIAFIPPSLVARARAEDD